MDQTLCPFLGTFDADQKRSEPITYPSFENRCWATGPGQAEPSDMLVLTDQATYCLGESHYLCPRYLAAQAGERAGHTPVAPGAAGEFGADWLTSDLRNLERELTLLDEEQAERRRIWGWLAAAALFLMVFAGASLMALYAGWSYVRSVQGAAGSLETLAAAQPPPEPVYLVMTATAAPLKTATPTVNAVLVAPPATVTRAFPEAVTPTPAPGSGDEAVIVVDPNALNAGPPAPDARAPSGANPGVQAVAPPDNSLTQPAAPQEPVFDFDQPVPEAPTRRPTPAFEIPTSTPVVVEASPTPVPILGPPVVIFKPDNRSLERKQCTIVRWAVQNVREVYYEGIGVNGEGEREECIDDENEIYTLSIVLPNGSTEIYTTTVKYIAPTPTASYTPTVTPTPYYTPTWTPVAPTATPTPNLTFGVNLGVDGSVVRTCAAGSRCTATVVVTNTGSGNDDLNVSLRGGEWSPQLCRGDGVCSDNVLVVSGVAPGNAAYVEFAVNVPGDAQGRRVEYALEAASGATNGAVRSAPVIITVEVP